MHEVNNFKMLHSYIRLLSSELIGSECEFLFVFKQLSLPNLTGKTIINLCTSLILSFIPGEFRGRILK